MTSSSAPSSTSPIRQLFFFKSNPSKDTLATDPQTEREHSSSSSSRLQKLFKNKNALATSADRDRVLSAVADQQPRSILYNFIMSSSGTSNSSTPTTTKEQKRSFSPIPTATTSSMLLPPISLFPLTLPQKSSGIDNHNHASKSGLFSKTKQERITATEKPPKEKKTSIATKHTSSTPVQISAVAAKPWGGWSGGASNPTPQITIHESIDDVKKVKVGGGARRIWRSLSPSRPDERNRDEKSDVETKQRKFYQPKSPTRSNLERHQEQQQIMLHPSSNTSNRTVVLSPSSSSSSSLCLCHLDGQSPPQQQQTIHSRQDYFDHSSQLTQQSKPAPSRFNVTLAVHDIFGVGKVTEMMLALFLAHDAFLCRRPFWLQCSILAWEAVVVLMILWTLMRVVGLFEVIVWGADDLVRGTVSILRQVAQVIQTVFSR